MQHLVVLSAAFTGKGLNVVNEKMIVEENVPCELRDGTILRSDIYRPNEGGYYPVLMLRLPYDKKTKRYYDEYVEVPRMVAAGYIVILQDVRGRFASDGEFYPFIHERNDGYDAVEWAAKLPYANGKVGLFGMSYHGYTQLAAAVEKPPSLKAIAPVMTMADPWQDLLSGYEAASSSANLQTWTLGSIIFDQLKRRNDPRAAKAPEYINKLTEWLYEKPAKDWTPMKDLDPDSFYFDVINEKLASDHIAKMQVKEKLADIEIPALFMGGWFDSLLGSTLEAYQIYHGPRMLWIGPWTHEQMTGQAGDKYFANAKTNIGVDKLEDPTEIHINWFDKWLKDKPLSMEKPVHLYLMQQKRWEAYVEWSPVSRKKELYLASNGNAQTRNGDGKLLDTPEASETKCQLCLDPGKPVPTRGGGVLIAGHNSGMFQIGDIQDREDVLVYNYPFQEKDIHILGTVKASIWVSAFSPLLDLAVRLSDVEPTGDVYNIIDTFYRQKVTELDMPFCVELVIGHTAYTIKKGHQLRLDITASNAPLYDVNLNNGQTTRTASSGNPQFQQVYQGGNLPSKITLPLSTNVGV